MVITARTGRQFSVQFVHSSVRPFERPFAPGSVRQFVDSLAVSLRRRVTLAEVSRLFGPNGTSATHEALGQGFAVCHSTDQFNKATGRFIALKRALENTDPADILDSEVGDIWIALSAQSGLHPVDALEAVAPRQLARSSSLIPKLLSVGK